MTSISIVRAVSASIVAGLVVAGRAEAQSGAASYPGQVAPIVAKYCGQCHGATKPKGGIDLASARDEAAVVKNLKGWRKALENVESGAMPPDDAARMTEAEATTLKHYLQAVLSKADCRLNPDPGRVTLRRLNREEYNNTIRDLVGVDFRPADDFPSDDVGYGFDNIGDVLTLPPILLEKYLAAAEAVADQAILADEAPRGPTRRWKAGEIPGAGDHGNADDQGGLLMYTNAEIGVADAFPRNGNYILRARAYGQRAGKDLPRLELRVDGRPVKGFDVKAEEHAPETYEARGKVRRGARLSVAFTNDAYYPDDPDVEHRDRNLNVEAVEVVGPLYSLPHDLPDSHKRIIFRRPTALDKRTLTREILARFATRAYRRPATPAEVERLAGLVEMAEKDGERFEKGIQLAVQAVLVSPHFLFRVELETRPGAPRALTDLEFASRLSYFLWSSMPDDELLDLATKAQLRAGRNLDAQVARMLKDPRSRAFVENFSGQWLQTRNLKLANPDRGRFDQFDEPLRRAMQREVELFFAAIVREDRPISDFLQADYTFLNERLARHYGINGVKGDQFRRVPLTDRRRGGVVTMASVLTVTSNPTRTSPVKRGKWILEEILGTPPPPPPPGVADIPDDDSHKDAPRVSVRAKMEKHRANPNCASCHARMDPLGFALENFDAIGGYRGKDGELPVDNSGVLPDGRKFAGPVELKAVLQGKMKPFARCLAEKLMTYALGRGLEYSDHCVVDALTDATIAGGGKFSTLVAGIVRSDPFGKRGAEGSPTKP